MSDILYGTEASNPIKTYPLYGTEAIKDSLITSNKFIYGMTALCIYTIPTYTGLSVFITHCLPKKWHLYMHGKVTALGVLCCFANCCLFDLAYFFLPSFSSLIHVQGLLTVTF